MPLPPRWGAWGSQPAKVEEDVPAQPVKVEDIHAEAEAIIKLLDKAAASIEHLTGPSIVKYVQELDKIIELVQMVQQQQSLQVASVAAALVPLRTSIGSLELVLGSPSASGTSRRLANAINEVCQAGKNLREQLPGDVLTATNNEAKDAFQNNATIGGDRPDRRLVVEATGNKATDAAQVNAPIYGDNGLDGIAKIMMALKGKA
ncbi:hypothetical protein MAPG_03109 [Magnaporthiopsis poae ATCC 64411]|uniref:Uncharacterized protein n=1 Tax=Magnaporthiopsis poae (strain ATCC 64411 / 73-15) TaxID=644358 RepID=A0A0C4DT52_MAGP6|nr:hypothetical protein MAPG_03109 [Magnaporthiopsis poae ATCC 64411]